MSVKPELTCHTTVARGACTGMPQAMLLLLLLVPLDAAVAAAAVPAVVAGGAESLLTPTSFRFQVSVYPALLSAS